MCYLFFLYKVTKFFPDRSSFFNGSNSIKLGYSHVVLPNKSFGYIFFLTDSKHIIPTRYVWLRQQLALAPQARYLSFSSNKHSTHTCNIWCITWSTSLFIETPRSIDIQPPIIDVYSCEIKNIIGIFSKSLQGEQPLSIPPPDPHTHSSRNKKTLLSSSARLAPSALRQSTSPRNRARRVIEGSDCVPQAVCESGFRCSSEHERRSFVVCLFACLLGVSSLESLARR